MLRSAPLSDWCTVTFCFRPPFVWMIKVATRSSDVWLASELITKTLFPLPLLGDTEKSSHPLFSTLVTSQAQSAVSFTLQLVSVAANATSRSTFSISSSALLSSLSEEQAKRHATRGSDDNTARICFLFIPFVSLYYK